MSKLRKAATCHPSCHPTHDISLTRGCSCLVFLSLHSPANLATPPPQVPAATYPLLWCSILGVCRVGDVWCDIVLIQSQQNIWYRL